MIMQCTFVLVWGFFLVIPAPGKQIMTSFGNCRLNMRSPVQTSLTVRHLLFAHLKSHDGNALKTSHWPALESGARCDQAAV